jgi:hypothetical protein
LGGDVFQVNERFFVHFTGLSYGTGQTSYTNGFNFSQVMSALYGRVGWQQGDNDPTLESVNTLSKSGRHFNIGFHALVTIQNILEVMETVGATDNQLNAYLETIQRGVVLKCVNAVFAAPEYLKQSITFNRNWSGNDQPITNNGRFVGRVYRMPQNAGIGVQIDQVALYFDTDVTFNLYVFHDAIKAPLAVIEVSAIADTQTLVTLPDVVLNHIGPASLGGSFYVGYFQDDLGDAKAYREQYSDCARDFYSSSFINADRVPGQYNFDRRHVRMDDVNYGLNFHTSTFRDHTQLIVKQAALFDNALGLMMAAQVIEQIIYSVRSNGTERILKEAAHEVSAALDLNGVAPISDSPYTTGIKKQIAEEFAKMRKSFFPPKKAITANYGTNYYQ